MMGKDSLLVIRYDVTLFKSVCLSVPYLFIDSALLLVVNLFVQLKIYLSNNVSSIFATFVFVCLFPFLCSLQG